MAMPESDAGASAALRQTLEVSEFGLAMMREHLRRQHHGADEDAITSLLNQRLKELHANEFADGPFRAVRWPRPHV